MLGLEEDGVADDVVPINPLVFRRASDRMITKGVRVVATSWAWMGSVIYWEAKTVLKADAKVFRDDGETKNVQRDSIEKCARHWKSAREESSRGSMVFRSLEVFEER